MSGIDHKDVGQEITKNEWLSADLHEVSEGSSFPGSPTEKDLFYRTDLHKIHIYNGTTWVDLEV